MKRKENDRNQTYLHDSVPCLIFRGVDFQDENSGVLVVFSWDLVLGISLEMRKSMLTKEGLAHLNQYIRSMPSIFPCTLSPAKHFTADKVSKGPLSKIVDDYTLED